jgi:hypothetical protein
MAFLKKKHCLSEKNCTVHHPNKKERKNITMHPDVVMSTVKDVYGMNARSVVFQHTHSV